MKIESTLIAVLFAASAVGMAIPASAEEGCPWTHSDQTAESSSPIIAEGTTPQTPAPSPGG